MTADYLAQIVEKVLDKVDPKDSKSIEKYMRADSLLKDYIQNNFTSFKETELVYKHAKELCDLRNDFISLWIRDYFGKSLLETAIKLGIMRKEVRGGVERYYGYPAAIIKGITTKFHKDDKTKI